MAKAKSESELAAERREVATVAEIGEAPPSEPTFEPELGEGPPPPVVTEPTPTPEPSPEVETEVISVTSGEDTFIVKQNGIQKTLTTAEIEAVGGVIPVALKRESVLHEIGVSQGMQARREKEAEFARQDVATILGGREGISQEAAEATLARYRANPNADEFKTIAAGGSITLDQKAQLAEDASVSFNRRNEFFKSHIQVGLNVSGDKQYVAKVDADRIKATNPDLYDVLISSGLKAYESRITGIETTTVNKRLREFAESSQNYENQLQVFENQLEFMPEEFKAAYRTGGFDAYDKAIKEWESKNLILGDYSIPISSWNELPPEYQSLAIRQGVPEINKLIENDRKQIEIINAELEKQRFTQDEALRKLSSMGYAVEKPELYRAVKEYNIWEYINDNPNLESVQLLSDAGFSPETIDKAREYVNELQSTITKMDDALSLAMIKESGGMAGVDPNALSRALRNADIPLVEGSGVSTWRQLSDKEKEKIIVEYTNDPSSRNVAASIAAGYQDLVSGIKEDLVTATETIQPTSLRGAVRAGGQFANTAMFIVPMMAAGVADAVIENLTAERDYSQLEWQDLRTGEVITNEQYQALSGGEEQDQYALTSKAIDMMPLLALPPLFALGMKEFVVGAVKKIPKGGVATGEGLAEAALILLPFGKYAKARVKNVVARVRPDTLTGNALALTTDVGRVELPKGMPEMAARQLLEDVETAQLTGKVLKERLNAYSDVAKGIPDNLLELVEITKDPIKGTTDIVFKSADGNVVGHVSGFQRIMNDVIYHATGDTVKVMGDVKGRGYFEVVAEEGRHPVMYYSPQVAQSFMYRTPGQSPGVVAVRLTPDMWKQLPKEVLDSPTASIMRDKLFELAEKGQLEPGVYPLNKGYGRPLTFENEVVIAPGTKFYPAKSTWYAPDTTGAPMTRFQSNLNYSGKEGRNISVGDSLPMYWFGTEQAIAKGMGVPSVIDMYAGKLLGDLTLIRQWLPWNIRIRGKAPETLEGVSSPNPLYSTFQQFKLKVRPEDTGAGRVSGIIYNENGQVLLTRTQGANHYDLPGGGTLRREGINKAITREVYEETGLKPTYIEHIDTINSTFTPKGTPRKFQIFEIESKGKPSFGREIAEHIWWDGKSTLNHPISPFTRTAITRSIERANVIDNLTVAQVIADATKRAKEKAKMGGSEDVALVNELKLVSDAVDYSVLPYKSMINEKALALSALVVGETIYHNEIPKELMDKVGENRVVVSSGLVDADNLKTMEIPERPAYIAEKARVSDVVEEGIPTFGGLEIAESLEATEPIELFESIEPSEPLEPLEPTEPFEPTEPIEPVEPTEPLEPLEGLEPLEPTEPIEPAEPLEPTEPIEPIEGIELIDIPEITVPPEPIAPPLPPPRREPRREEEVELPRGSVAWIQGRPEGGPMFKLITPPYRQEDLTTLRDAPAGYVDEGFTGEGSAFKSLQILGGEPSSDIRDIDLGWTRINIKVGGEKPVIEYVHDVEANVGERSRTVGMGKGQIPIEAWEDAKAKGTSFEDFVNTYAGEEAAAQTPDIADEVISPSEISSSGADTGRNASQSLRRQAALDDIFNVEEEEELYGKIKKKRLEGDVDDTPWWDKSPFYPTKNGGKSPAVSTGGNTYYGRELLPPDLSSEL
ncbi:hypothetical protein LCGC14_1103340 [marine sediment metagenome]|uniref:Nudix hydrolase domain-containing protein n=1 Tax=marine sediment metagenome TaxID=412755 RepID=A0A0F9MDE2_9ZZZZ